MKKGNIQAVSFDEVAHRYFYEGHELNGVTTAIAKKLGKFFPKNSPVVQLACSYGSQVHKEIERWIEDKVNPETENGKWLQKAFLKFKGQVDKEDKTKYNAEVRVSDFDTTASNVDVVLHTLDGVYLFDIKTGNFDRRYCTLQLNAYRVMYENSYDEKVLGMYVVNTKSKSTFRILISADEEILKLLKENRK